MRHDDNVSELYHFSFRKNGFFSFDPWLIREQDGQASGGNDFGSDDWIFTIREKDPKKLQNGEGQSGLTDQVRRLLWNDLK